MAPSVVYETVCPACSRPFDLPAGSSEGNCPHCKAYLRFVEEEPAPEPTPPTSEPPVTKESPAPEASATAGSTASPAQAAAEVPPPRIGEFRVTCAACHRG